MTWTLHRLQALLDAYGSDVSRWPEGSAEGLAAFLAAHPEGTRLMTAEKQFDELLAAAPLVAEARLAGVADRTVAAAHGAQRASVEGDPMLYRNAARGPLAPRIMPAAGLLAASLVIGFYLGAANPLPAEATATIEGDLLTDVVAVTADPSDGDEGLL
jgi:hypothetical protein